jgi:Mg2+ and Co2+ transporter CorA
MNVGGTPFSNSPSGFWMVGGLTVGLTALFAIVLLRFVFGRR